MFLNGTTVRAEAEILLLEETRKRIQTEQQNTSLVQQLKQSQNNFLEYKTSVRFEEEQRLMREQTIREQKEKIDIMEKSLS